MTKYYIFRHGLAIPKGEEYGPERVWTAQLMESGLPAVERLAHFLKTQASDYRVTSPVLRCQQTVDIVANIADISFDQDERLREFDEYNHEPFTQLRGRVEDFLKEVRNQNYSSVFICTHGAVISCLKHLLLEGNFQENQLLDFPNPAGVVIIENGQVEVKEFE